MPMNETYYFIINVKAGAGRKTDIWNQRLKPMLHQRGIHYHAYVCDHPGHGREYAGQIQAKNPGEICLVVVGGDGTFNEVLNGITDFERVRLGFVPTGSANDLGYCLGIDTDPVRALDQVLDGRKSRPMDIGKITMHKHGDSRYFAISSGIGLDAEVCRLTAIGKLKAVLNRLHLGKLIYLINAVRIVFMQPLTTGKLVFEDKKGRQMQRRIHSLYFLAGMNQPCEGGHLPMAKNASAFDGKLSFAMAHDLSRPRALVSLGLLALGRTEGIPGYEVIEAKKCHIMLKDQLEVHTDGEPKGTHWDITLECLPKKLNIMM